MSNPCLQEIFGIVLTLLHHKLMLRADAFLLQRLVSLPAPTAHPLVLAYVHQFVPVREQLTVHRQPQFHHASIALSGLSVLLP